MRVSKVLLGYDIETSTVGDSSVEKKSFPILHSFGYRVNHDSVLDVFSYNVEDCVRVEYLRTTDNAVKRFVELYDYYNENTVINAIVLVQNLAFDYVVLSDFFNRFPANRVKIFAKSSVSPFLISVINDAGDRVLSFIDTRELSRTSLMRMGVECNYDKSGDWDYSLVRNPKTVLTDFELDYAARDIRVMFAWIGHYCRSNNIPEKEIGSRVLTSTGTVRYLREKYFGNIKIWNNMSARSEWLKVNREMRPKSERELFFMRAATRGGFTFVSGRNAGKCFDFSRNNSKYEIVGLDAVSQHPAQMVTRLYPRNFQSYDTGRGVFDDLVADIISTPVEAVLVRWEKPFRVAFNALFKFRNLRPKAGSIWERMEVFPLSKNRIKSYSNSGDADFNEYEAKLYDRLLEKGFKDEFVNPKFVFGKVASADLAHVFITEIELWIIAQCYDFDGYEIVDGFFSTEFKPATAFSIMSVMFYFENKALFKRIVEEYKHGCVDTLENNSKRFSRYITSEMLEGNLSVREVEDYYSRAIKPMINALFGIECTGEDKPDSFYSKVDGIVISSEIELKERRNPKVYYQYGQRIVGWSRAAQVCAILCLQPIIHNIICGDTDSIKFTMLASDKDKIPGLLKQMNDSIAIAKENIIRRFRGRLPDNYFNELEHIGEYEHEFSVKRFAAFWNKAYCFITESGKWVVRIAGLNTEFRPLDEDGRKINGSITDLAERVFRDTGSFAKAAITIFNYNNIFDYSVCGFTGRVLPKWGERFRGVVRDYRGVEGMVDEPRCITIFNSCKQIGDFDNADNLENYRRSKRNNSNITGKRRTIIYNSDKERWDFL